MVRSPASVSQDGFRGRQMHFVINGHHSEGHASTSKLIRSTAARNEWKDPRQRKLSGSQPSVPQIVTSHSSISSQHKATSLRSKQAKSIHIDVPSSYISSAGQQRSKQNKDRRLNFLETVLLEEYPLWAAMGNASDPFNRYPAPWNPAFGTLLEFWVTYISPGCPKEISHGWDSTMTSAFANVPLVASVNSSEPAAFYSILALSAVMLPDTHPLAPSRLPRLSQTLQTKALATLNTALTKAQQATGNSTIVALVALACLAMYFGQHAAVRSIYLPRLKRIVEARGGLGQIARESGLMLPRWCAWGDCVLTSQAGRSPLFLDFENASKDSTGLDHH